MSLMPLGFMAAQRLRQRPQQTMAPQEPTTPEEMLAGVTSPAMGPALRSQDPDFLRYQLEPLDVEAQNLQQQLQQIQGFMGGNGQRPSTPMGAALGGLGDIIRAGVGTYRKNQLQKKMEALGLKREGVIAQAGQGPSTVLRKAMAAGKPQLSTDPKSEESRRWQAYIEANAPGVYSSEQLSGIPAFEGDAALKHAMETLRERRLKEQAGQLATRMSDQLAWQKTKAEQDAARATEKATKSAASETQKTEDGLRKEFGALPEVKDFNAFDASYKGLKASLQRKGGVGSTAAIFSFMKLIDPGVAVMEGDVDRIRSSGGPASAYADLYQYVLNGNTLPDKVRGEMQTVADDLYSVRKAKYDERLGQYRGLGEQRGLDVGRILPGGGAPRVPVNATMPLDASGNPTIDTGAMVKMLSPSGEEFMVPEAEVGGAEARKWKRAP